MNISICEDIPAERERLCRLVFEQLERQGVNAVIHGYQDGEGMLNELDRYPPAICLLDIYMDGISGVELAKHICERQPECAIIFVTSSNEHMAEGFEIGVVHYLLKPVDGKQVALALKRALRITGFEPQYVKLIVNRQFQKIRFADILYVESQARYCHIYLASKAEPLRVYIKLNELALRLSARRFLRCHQSYIVNLDAVSSLAENNTMFRLKNKILIPIRRQNRSTHIAAYENYCFEQSRRDML